MEPLLANPLNEGHNRKNLYNKYKILVPTGVANTFLTFGRRKTLFVANMAKKVWSQSVRYREVACTVVIGGLRGAWGM